MINFTFKDRCCDSDIFKFPSSNLLDFQAIFNLCTEIVEILKKIDILTIQHILYLVKYGAVLIVKIKIC
ncbi:hypothetical protein [Candidatus Tisiphia endosymbiont of Sialis lutaria]|uniref:hypothetical protein n=1 Tax=Candidatus Tisiphia endosymbiont of Sialis lutaria TaxID=2029164 RepID=UPI00312CAC6B